MQHVRKDILFFSNYCDYCNDVLNLMIKKNIKNDFMMVNIDNKSYQLPNFVDRVPIIYTKNDEVIYDDGIIKYIESISPQEVQDILPFSLHQPNYSSEFSYLEDMTDIQNKGYTMLGYDQKIMAPTDDSDASNKKGKFDSSVLDKLVQARDADLNNFKKILNNGNGFNRL